MWRVSGGRNKWLIEDSGALRHAPFYVYGSVQAYLAKQDQCLANSYNHLQST